MSLKVGLSLKFRRAVPDDAEAIYQVADSAVYQKLRDCGCDEHELSRNGFLFYPLAASGDGEPNYRERIEASRHFWVAVDDLRVVGYLMAYSFACLDSIPNKSANDLSVLAHFCERLGFRRNVIYSAQSAVLATYRKQGISYRLKQHAFERIDAAEHPAVVSEVAQWPLWNEASTRSLLKCGFAPLLLREKETGVGGQRRLTATFIKTFAFKGFPTSAITD
jgi:GNAT superfamily N-acetyltransferase